MDKGSVSAGVNFPPALELLVGSGQFPQATNHEHARFLQLYLLHSSQI